MNTHTFSVQSLDKRLSGRLLGSRIEYHDSLISTMDEAQKLAKEGAPEGTVVITEHQIRGRGRFNRSWIGTKNQDLLFSILLCPSPAQIRYVNMAVSLALCQAINLVSGLVARIKWPNDIYINSRKVAGILIDSVWEKENVNFMIIGVGLNVNSDPSTVNEITETATSLQKEAGFPQQREELLATLLERLDDLYTTIKEGTSLTRKWASHIETIGQFVQVRLGNRVYEGSVRDVDEEGNLILSQTDGTARIFVAGEVTLN